MCCSLNSFFILKFLLIYIFDINYLFIYPFEYDEISEAFGLQFLLVRIDFSYCVIPQSWYFMVTYVGSSNYDKDLAYW